MSHTISASSTDTISVLNQEPRAENGSSASLLYTTQSRIEAPFHESSVMNNGSASVNTEDENRKRITYTQFGGLTGSVDVEKNMTGERYKSFVHQFNVKVALSTFACSLIVAHASLVNGIARTHQDGSSKGYIGNGIPYNVGLLLSFLAIAFHAASIIISGRGAVLCSDLHVIGQHPIEYFERTLVLCEHLQLDGIVFFVLVVFESSFLVFDHYVYPLIFCGLSLFGIVLFFSGKYREVSVVYKDYTFIKGFIRNRWMSS
ncbi:hypothetical protein AX15_002688 [Amanita polypyramis BW_CC]|nr:hypothetical protein AX15_002688 [Amanita polypyramis BW_CC]